MTLSTLSSPPESIILATRRPAFSIITATFNSGSLFDRTAASLRAQTLRDFEWIVVDGGSKDDTVQRIQLAGNLVDMWISEADRGISDAWNKGLARAGGQYVLLLNAGDTYDAGFLNSILVHCDGQRIVCSHARRLTESGYPAGTFRAEPYKLYRAMHLPHNWCAVPLRHYRELGGYVEMPLAMDFDWFHRYFRRHGVDGFIVVDEVLGSYHLGGKSDVNHVASFRANQDILISHGSNPLLAFAWRCAYTAKHAWQQRQLARHG